MFEWIKLRNRYFVLETSDITGEAIQGYANPKTNKMIFRTQEEAEAAVEALKLDRHALKTAEEVIASGSFDGQS